MKVMVKFSSFFAVLIMLAVLLSSCSPAATPTNTVLDLTTSNEPSAKPLYNNCGKGDYIFEFSLEQFESQRIEGGGKLDVKIVSADGAVKTETVNSTKITLKMNVLANHNLFVKASKGSVEVRQEECSVKVAIAQTSVAVQPTPPPVAQVQPTAVPPVVVTTAPPPVVQATNTTAPPATKPCPSIQEIRNLSGASVESITNEPCGYTWNGKGATVFVRCPKTWVCGWVPLKENVFIVQEGNNQTEVIYAGNWRYPPSYPSWDAIQDVCMLVEKERNFAGNGITVRFQPIPGGKVCT